MRKSILNKCIIATIVFLICSSYSFKIIGQIPDTAIGNYHYNKISLHNFDTLYSDAQQAAFHLQPTQDWKRINDCYYLMSVAKYYNNDFFESISIAQKLIAFAAKKPGKTSRGYTDGLNILGWNYASLGAYQEALELYQTAIKLHRKRGGNSLILSEYYENLGIFGNEIEEYNLSIESLENAIRLNPEPSSSIYRNLGIAFLKSNQFFKAKKCFYKSIVLIKDKKDKYKAKQEYDCYQWLGKIYIDESNLDSAQICINKVFQIRDCFEEDFIENHYRYQLLGELLEKQGLNELADQNYDIAIETIRMKFSNFNRHQEVALMLGKKAVFFQRTEQLKKALSTYQLALTQNTLKFESTSYAQNPKLDDFVNLSYGLDILIGKTKLLYQIYNKESKNKKILLAAFSASKLAIELILKIRQEYQSEGSKSILSNKVNSFYDLVIQIAIELFSLTQEDQYLKEAFHFSQINKSLLLLESIQQREALQINNIPKSLIDKEKQLRLQIAFLKKKITEEKQKPTSSRDTTLVSWETDLFRFKESYQFYLDSLSNLFPNYKKQTKQFEIASVENLQENLTDSQHGLLAFYVGIEKIYTFLITKNEILFSPSENTLKYEKATKELVEILSAPPQSSSFDADFERFTVNTTTIFNNLIRPVLSKSSLSKLTIIPDNFFNYIPFEILLTTKNNTNNIDYHPNNLNYFFESYIINYQFSANLFVNQNNDYTFYKPAKLLTFAPTFGANRSSGLDELVCNQQEGRDIQKILLGNLFVEDKASKGAFLKYASTGDILHLATHVQMNLQQPNLSKLFFSDEYITPFDLTALSLNNQLTVLSACNTGNGKFITGEGIMSLAREFRLAGSQSTLTSLWTIDDCSTVDIMKHFYNSLSKGDCKDEAIRNAKLDFLSSANIELRHPYYWSAFLLSGSTCPISISPNLWCNIISFLSLSLCVLFFIKIK